MSAEQPIYVRVFDHICIQVMSRNLNEGERAPSMRKLAVNWEINPNTVMRAYALLAEAGVIVNRRGVGFFIAHDATQKALAKQRHEFIAAELPRFTQKMRALGFSFSDLEVLGQRLAKRKPHKTTKNEK